MCTAKPPHEGRGGWTWYTGSAGWLYRAGLEWILGFRLRGDQLVLAPCVPPEWPGFTLHYQHRGTPYVIHCERKPAANALVQLTVDGQVLKVGRNIVDLVTDGATHHGAGDLAGRVETEDLAATQACKLQPVGRFRRHNRPLHDRPARSPARRPVDAARTCRTTSSPAWWSASSPCRWPWPSPSPRARRRRRGCTPPSSPGSRRHC